MSCFCEEINEESWPRVRASFSRGGQAVSAPGENPEEGNLEEDKDSDKMDRVPLRSVFGQSVDKAKRKATTAVAC